MTKIAAALGLAVLFASAQAFAQVPVYTNADLGKPRAKVPHKITEQEYRSLLANQFVYVPDDPSRYYGGPTVAVATYTPPSFGVDMPQPSWIAQPFQVAPYGGWGSYDQWNGGFGNHRGARQHVRHDPPAAPPTPTSPVRVTPPPRATPPPPVSRPAVRGSGMIRR